MTSRLASCLRSLAALALLAGAATAQFPPLGLPPTLVDVPYGPYADPDQPASAERLDLYAHADATGPQPVLIEIHGGGWSKESKSKGGTYLADEQGLGILERAWGAGFAVVSIDYPLTAPAYLDDLSPNPAFPRNTYHRAAFSTRRAIQFVRSQAEAWGLDRDRVYLIGGSAGGNLALWAAMSRDVAKPKSQNAVARESSRPNGVVFCWTPVLIDGAHLLSAPDRPAQWEYFGAKSQAAFDKVPVKRTRAASPAWRAAHENGSLQTSAKAVQRNATMPLLGVYANFDPEGSSSSYTFPLIDPHSAAMGLLMKEAFDGYAEQTGDPAAHWTDFTLLDVDLWDPVASGIGADAVVTWLKLRAGLAP